MKPWIPMMPMLAAALVLTTAGCPEEEAGHAHDEHPGAEEAHEGAAHADEGRDAHGHEEESGHREGVVELTPQAAARADLRTTAAEARALPAVLRTTAQVGLDERRTAHVSPLVTGRLQRVQAELGDDVEQGQVLAVLESVELGRAKAEYLQAAAAVRRTRATLDREERLLEEQITSEQAVLEARAAYDTAVSALSAARETLRLLGMGAEGIRNLRVGDAGAALFPLQSPLDGRVLDRHASTGEQVSPEDEIFTVSDLSRVWIWIDVFERDIGRVHRGDAVVVRTRAWPERTFEGEVTYIRDIVDPATRTARARIEVENADRALKPGMFAEVTVLDPHADNGGPEAVVIPSSALQRKGDGWVAFVRTGERTFEERELSLGLRTEDFVEVRGGVADGEDVVSHGAFLLKSELAKESMGGGHSH